MIELDPKTNTITITECLSFDAHVLPDYEDIRSDIEQDVEKLERLKVSLTPNEISELNGMKEFVEHELTQDDKNEMLQYIMDEYERASNYYSSASLFDEKIIHECVLSWIQDNFEFGADY